MNDISKERLKHIVVVEDDPIVLKAVQIALETIGDFVAETCGNGETALEKIKTCGCDLVLLDYKLPDMDGLELYEILKEEPALSQIPVIFMTGSVMPEDIRAYEAAGAIGVIPKPFDTRTLAGVVESMWQERER